VVRGRAIRYAFTNIGFDEHAIIDLKIRGVVA
jgi:hypothetical protein